MEKEKEINNKAVGVIKQMIESPLFFIEKMWGLKQLQEGEEFIKGKHITNQQLQLILAVEKAIHNEGKKRITVRSGHGTGKTTVLSWIILWFLFTRKEAQVPCTAPTSDQMFDVLWKECNRWIQKMPKQFSQIYDWSNSYIRIKESPHTWFARAKTARKEAPEALAGIHGEHVLFIIDESSGVPDEVFKVAEGALTEENILVIMCSNPTRLLGYFYDSHNTDDAWERLHFSSADSPLVDNVYNQRIIDKHGEDSDEYRIRVLGEFPRADAVDEKGYVPLLLETDLQFTEDGIFGVGKRLGIDPSGQGRDETVWVLRDTIRAKVLMKEKISTPKGIADKTIQIMDMYDIDPYEIYVDNFGVGANVAQEMALMGKNIRSINVGDSADEQERFINKRAEAYWRLREWLKTGAMLFRDEDWKQLLGIRYRSELSGKMKVMSKQDMKSMGLSSPDVADALMLTFYRSEYYNNKSEYRDSYYNQYGTTFQLNE